MGAIAYALQLIGEAEPLIAAGVNVANLLKTGSAALKAMQDENRDPSPAEWDALNAQIKALREELHAQ